MHFYNVVPSGLTCLVLFGLVVLDKPWGRGGGASAGMSVVSEVLCHAPCAKHGHLLRCTYQEVAYRSCVVPACSIPRTGPPEKKLSPDTGSAQLTPTTIPPYILTYAHQQPFTSTCMRRCNVHWRSAAPQGLPLPRAVQMPGTWPLWSHAFSHTMTWLVPQSPPG